MAGSRLGEPRIGIVDGAVEQRLRHARIEFEKRLDRFEPHARLPIGAGDIHEHGHNLDEGLAVEVAQFLDRGGALALIGIRLRLHDQLGHALGRRRFRLAAEEPELCVGGR